MKRPATRGGPRPRRRRRSGDDRDAHDQPAHRAAARRPQRGALRPRPARPGARTRRGGLGGSSGGDRHGPTVPRPRRRRAVAMCAPRPAGGLYRPTVSVSCSSPAAPGSSAPTSPTRCGRAPAPATWSTTSATARRSACRARRELHERTSATAPRLARGADAQPYGDLPPRRPGRRAQGRWRSPGYDADVNIIGTINVLEAARSVSARVGASASTGGAGYGEYEGLPVPTPETAPTGPLSHYGMSKMAGEGYCALYGRSTAPRPTSCASATSTAGPPAGPARRGRASWRSSSAGCSTGRRRASSATGSRPATTSTSATSARRPGAARERPGGGDREHRRGRLSRLERDRPDRGARLGGEIEFAGHRARRAPAQLPGPVDKAGTRFDWMAGRSAWAPGAPARRGRRRPSPAITVIAARQPRRTARPPGAFATA